MTPTMKINDIARPEILSSASPQQLLGIWLGYHQTTLAALAKQLGVTRQHMYQVARGKVSQPIRQRVFELTGVKL